MGGDVLNIRANLELRDVPVTIDFYRRTLGLEPLINMGEPPVFALLAGGPGLLGIAEEPVPAVAQIVACYVDVTDVEASFRRCTETGLRSWRDRRRIRG